MTHEIELRPPNEFRTCPHCKTPEGFVVCPPFIQQTILACHRCASAVVLLTTGEVRIATPEDLEKASFAELTLLNMMQLLTRLYPVESPTSSLPKD